MDVEVWTDTDSDISDNFINNEDNDSPPPSPPSLPSPSTASSTVTDKTSKALVAWIVGFFLLLHAKFHIRNFVLQIVFRFLKVFFVVMGRVYTSCGNIGNIFPASLYRAQREYFIDSKAFKTYCVCKRCHTIRSLQESIEGVSTNRKAMHCCHIPFAAGRHNRKCGGVLLKTVELATGIRKFYPLHTFCFVDLQTSLQHLLLHPEFTTSSEHWRSSSVSHGVLRDVYDGRIWKSFLKWNNKPFLEEPFTFAALINVDWFQPY